jgi:CelD/BcsL family acetyltransferase involved in cellulose biosynthesis
VSWEFHPAPAAYAQYAADWDRLNTELYGGHPYFDSRFVGPLLTHFASGRERLCLYRVQGVVRGALILLPLRGGRWASFRPAQAQITPILVADAQWLKQLLKALPGFAWSIEFHAVDPRYAPAFSCARAETIVFAHANTIGVDPGIGFEKYWNQRSKNLRSNIRRYLNRLEREAGTADLHSLATPEDMADGVRRFGELESAGWKAAAGTAVSIGNVQGSFYAEVLANFAATGQAEICELAIGGQLAASRLLIGNARMLVILKTTYDESLARFAPSRLLLHRLLERQLTEHAAMTVEFYTNATRDQAEWATFNCTIQNIQLFRSDGAIVAYTLLKALKRRLAGLSQNRTSADEAASEFEAHACASLEDFVTGDYPLDEFAPRHSIEDSIDWFGLLQKHVYPDDPNIRYYFVADQGRPTAILPLRRTTHGAVRTLESLSNYYTSLYAPLLGKDCDLLALRHLLTAATRENRGAHVMRFAPMDPDAPGYTALMNELRATGWIPLTFFCFGNWFLKVDGGWESYLRKRSANLRSSIKRRNREFVAEGGTLEIVSSEEGLEPAIAAFQEVYSASWKQPEPYPEFVPSLIRLLASNGMLRLGIARLRGQPIAAQLWIVGHGKASIYKVAYHHVYASLSPGTVLTSYLLRHVIDQDRVREVDFLIGDDEYKKIWMSDRRERWGIVAFNPRTVIGFGLLVREVAGRMARSLSKKFRAGICRIQFVHPK